MNPNALGLIRLTRLRPCGVPGATLGRPALQSEIKPQHTRVSSLAITEGTQKWSVEIRVESEEGSKIAKHDDRITFFMTSVRLIIFS
jgi:hypothetical protein